MKKRKYKYSNIIITILVILLVLLIIITSMLGYGLIKDLTGKKNTQKVEIVDNIESYDYHLTENNTKYYKDLYSDLKDVLNNEDSETFEDDYASLISQLFVADFYDLNSKLNKTDIGGVQFIYEGYEETFKNFASDQTGIYYYVENNTYGERDQKLPEVKEVTVNEITNTTYKYQDINDENAYQVKLYIEYKEALGYPENVTLVLVHNGKKLEVVSVS